MNTIGAQSHRGKPADILAVLIPCLLTTYCSPGASVSSRHEEAPELGAAIATSLKGHATPRMHTPHLWIILKPEDLATCANHASRWRTVLAEAHRYSLEVSFIYPATTRRQELHMLAFMHDHRLHAPVEMNPSAIPLGYMEPPLVERLFGSTPVEILVAREGELVVVRNTPPSIRGVAGIGSLKYPSEHLREFLEKGVGPFSHR